MRLLPGLVGEQQRAGLRRGRRLASSGARTVHSSSSTTIAPPATRSPSATCTLRTTPVVGRDERRLHLHRLEHDERLPRLDGVALRDEHAQHGAGHRRRDRAVLAAGAVPVRGGVSSGGACVGGEGRLSRNEPCQTGGSGRPRLGQRRVLGRGTPSSSRRPAAPGGRRASAGTGGSSSRLAPRSRRARPPGGRAPRRASRRRRSASRSSGRRRCRPRRPPRRRRPRGSRPGAGGARGVPSAGGTCAGPRRRAAPRPRGPGAAAARATRRPRRAPAARRRGRARDELRHGMLDLDASVQLQEEEVAPVEHELGGARAPVGDRLREPDGGVATSRRAAPDRVRARATPRAPSGGGAGPSTRARRARSRRPARRRGAGSRRAAAARRTARRTRCRRRTPPSPRAARPRAPPRARPAERTTRIPRPPPPAAAFTSSGKPRLSRIALVEHGDAGLAGRPLRRELVPAGAQRLRRRSDEDEARRLDRFREIGVLGEEPVARVDRVCSGRLRCADVLLGVEVRGDLDRLAGDARVQRSRVVRGGNRDGRDPELAAGAEDAHRDLAAVRD